MIPDAPTNLEYKLFVEEEWQKVHRLGGAYKLVYRKGVSETATRGLLLHPRSCRWLPMPRERERKRVKESSAMCSRISVFQMSICFRAHGCWLDDGDDTGASNVKPWLSCGTCAFARFECHIICEVKATMYLCVFHTIFPFDMKSGGNARACATAPVENLKQFFSLRCCCYRCWFAWLRPNKRIHSQLMFHNNIFQNLVWINGFVWRTRQRTTPARSSSARHTTMMGCEWQICVTLAQLWIVCECMHLTAIFCVFFSFFRIVLIILVERRRTYRSESCLPFWLSR